MTQVSFTARIHWQSAADPTWEIETHHSDFRTAEEAALWANGFDVGLPGVQELALRAGRFTLLLTGGSRLAVAPAAVRVWHLTKEPVGEVATDDDFEPVTASPQDLTAAGLDGGWVPLAFGVLAPDASPLDVDIDFDDTGLPLVTVEKPDPDLSQQAASLLFGIVPRA